MVPVGKMPESENGKNRSLGMRDTPPTLFLAPFSPGQSLHATSRRCFAPHFQCSQRSGVHLYPSAVQPQNHGGNAGPNYSRKKTPHRRGRPIMKEILGAQRLRKEGNWKAAQALLETVKEEAAHDSNYLNEMLHVRVAELRQTKPTISAADMYDELFGLAESVPARSNATTFNAILLGLRNTSESRQSDANNTTGSELEIASQMFDTMLQKHLFPDHFTMSILFQMCAASRSFDHAKNFEEKAKNAFGFEANMISGSALLAAYAKCGQIDSVEQVLEDLASRNVLLNERTYASIISAYHRSGRHPKVIECFHAAMNATSVRPHIYLFSGALASCWKAKDSPNARLVFETMEEANIIPTEDIFTTLFEIALRSGDVQLGIQVLLDWAPRYGLLKPTASHFNRLFAACKKSLNSAEKIVASLKTVVNRMKEETDLEPEVATLNSLISAFMTLGSYADAQRVLERDFQRFGLVPDVVTYNTLIHGLGKVKGPDFALKVFKVMRKNGVKPNEVTYNSLVDLLVDARNLRLAAAISEEMRRDPSIETNSMQVSSQLKLYRNMKDPQSALRVYRKAMKVHRHLDSITHGLMLSTLFDSACEDEAISVLGWLVWTRQATPTIVNVVLDYIARVKKDHSGCLTLFESMKKKGIAPDEVSYSTLIQVCSRNGLIDRAFRLLGEMQDVGLGMADTYAWTALIDGCGRVGHWQRAVDLLKSMCDSGSQFKLIPSPTTSCYNAAIYAAGMRGGGWKHALEIYELLKADHNQEADMVTYSAMASTILRNRYQITQWGIVREVYGELKGFAGTDTGQHSQRAAVLRRNGDRLVRKKLAGKWKRLQWLLDQAVDGKLLKKPAVPAENSEEDDE